MVEWFALSDWSATVDWSAGDEWYATVDWSAAVDWSALLDWSVDINCVAVVDYSSCSKDYIDTSKEMVIMLNLDEHWCKWRSPRNPPPLPLPQVGYCKVQNVLSCIKYTTAAINKL